MGRNASEVRVGLERVDADADPSFARGRPRRQGSNRRGLLSGLPGYGTRHVGKVMRVTRETRPVGGRSFNVASGDGSDGSRTGPYYRRSRVTPEEGRALTSGMLSKRARLG